MLLFPVKLLSLKKLYSTYNGRYHTAAILISDSFERFEQLNMCKNVLQVLRDKVVDMAASRHMLVQFKTSIYTFKAFMMEDAGLLPVLRKQRQLKPPQPTKALMNEIRGDVLKEALLAKALANKRLQNNHQKTSHVDRESGHKPRSRRRSLTDNSISSESTAESLATADRKMERKPSISKRRPRDSEQGRVHPPRRVASASIVDSNHGEKTCTEPRSPRRRMSLRNLKHSEGIKNEKRTKRDERQTSRKPQKVHSFSKRRPLSSEPTSLPLDDEESDRNKNFSVQEAKSLPPGAKCRPNPPTDNDNTSGYKSPVQSGRIKLEPRKNTRL
ncbi:hypothetical protein IV203_016945 [Nitzschia inconspicua]|uniref:Uncharacterized protein n=1 Tax=Nitzschia inconspicua TaxID=303405 RepID=A0A9K3KS67_9STRA|nr:hypothetical protein IV203_016945 [Nitzschia inconspicua]